MGRNREPTLAGPVGRIAAPSIVELIGRQATARPGRIALRDAGGDHTFADLWSRAHAVAGALAESGVGPGDLVAVWGSRTAGTVVAALAVMRAGAGYVPIEPTHPTAQARAVVEAARARFVLTDGVTPPGGLPADRLDITTIPVPRPGSRQPALPAPRPEQVAYVVFTSGTSGVPKGVVVEHRSLVNYATWCAGLLGRSGSGTPLIGSLAYDLSMTSLWPQLIDGGEVVVCGGAWDQETLFGRPERYRYAKLTPSIARFFERTRRPAYQALAALLMFGGESLEPGLVRGIGDRLRGVRLINHYGPTETTIGCCFHEFHLDRLPDLPSVPIGRPITNTRGYVVDESLAPVPRGCPGELVIAGQGVARGYLRGDPDRRFIDEAELGGPAGPAYRTGDQVRVLEDGNLLFLGRRDDQLKVSGHRVELAELRRLALGVAGVADVAFGRAEGDSGALVAFVLPGPGASTDDLGARVRRAMAAALPAAVVPHRVHLVAEIAVNANGKHDTAGTARHVLADQNPSTNIVG